MKSHKALLLMMVTVMCFVTHVSAGTTYYWHPAGSSTSWYTVGNWRISSCNGTTSSAHPGSADTVVFDGNCSNANCTLDGGYTVAKLITQNSYSGTLTMQNSNVLTASVIELNSGTLTGAAGQITTNERFTLNGGTFTASSGTTLIRGKLEYFSGTFNHNNGLLIFKRTNSSSVCTLKGNSSFATMTCYKLDISSISGTTSITIDSMTMIATDTLWWSGPSQLTVNTNNENHSGIEAQKNVMITNSASSTGGNVLFKLTGSNNQTIYSSVSAGNGKLPQVVISKSGGTVTLSGSISVYNNWLNNYSGTVDAGSSTVIIYGNQNIIVGGSYSTTFNNLTFGGSSTSTDSISSSNGITANGTLTLQGSGNLTLKGGTLTQKGDISFTNSNSNSSINAPITFSGSNAQTLSGSGTFKPATVTMNKSSHALTLSLPMTVRTSLTMTTGNIVSSSTNILNLNDNATVSGASDASFVNGPIKKTGNDSFVFPTGKNGEYHSIEITAPGSTTDAFTAEYFDTTSAVIGTGKDTSMTHLNTCGYWNLARTTGSSQVKVQLDWNSHDCMVHVLSIMRIARWSSSNSKWENIGSVGTSGNATTGSIQSSSNQNSFGYFTLGKRSPAVYAHAGTDSTVCYNSTFTLGVTSTGTGGVPSLSYSWTPSSGLSSSTAANPTWTATDTTMFVVTVTDADYKTAKDTQWVFVPAPVVADAGNDVSLCQYNEFIGGATPTASGGKSPYQYYWKNEANDTIGLEANPSFFTDTSKTFSLKIIDSMGCVAYDTVKIIVGEPLMVVGITDTVLYPGESIELEDTIAGGRGSLSYTWSPNRYLNDSTLEAPTSTPLTAMTYKITVTDDLGCASESFVYVGFQPVHLDSLSGFAVFAADTLMAGDTSFAIGEVGAGFVEDSIPLKVQGNYHTDPTELAGLKVNLEAVMNEISDMKADGEDIFGSTNVVVESGVYRMTGNQAWDDTLTLNGNDSSVFIFDIDGDVTLGDNFVMKPDSAVNTYRIFFNINGTLIIGSSDTLFGTFLCSDRISGGGFWGSAAMLTLKSINLYERVDAYIGPYMTDVAYTNRSFLACDAQVLLPIFPHAGPPTGSNWTMMFDDEFNGPLNMTDNWDYRQNYKWYQWGGMPSFCQHVWTESYFDYHGPHVSNNPHNTWKINSNHELELYLWKKGTGNDASFPILPVYDTNISNDPIDFRYVGVHFQTDMNFYHGYFEIRAKVPGGDGMWPAFWLTGDGDNQDYREIDWFDWNLKKKEENVGIVNKYEQYQPWNKYFYPNYLCPMTHWTGHKNRYVDMSEGYHIYAGYWDENTIDYYIDGLLALSVPNQLSSDGKMRLVLTQGITEDLTIKPPCENWGSTHGVNDVTNSSGSNDGTKEGDNKFVIDYIRVYQKNSDLFEIYLLSVCNGKNLDPTSIVLPLSAVPSSPVQFSLQSSYLRNAIYSWSAPPQVHLVNGGRITTTSSSADVNLTPSCEFYCNTPGTYTVTLQVNFNDASGLHHLIYKDINLTFGSPDCLTIPVLNVDQTGDCSTVEREIYLSNTVAGVTYHWSYDGGNNFYPDDVGAGVIATYPSGESYDIVVMGDVCNNQTDHVSGTVPTPGPGVPPCPLRLGQTNTQAWDISIYPSPSDGFLWFENNSDDEVTVTLSDLLGRMIATFKVGGFEKVIKEALPDGMLIVETIRSGYCSTKQLIPVIANH